MEFAKETGADGQQVTATEFGDFTFVAEAGTHDLGRVTEVLVVIVDLSHRLHAGIFRGCEVFACALFVPVENATDERRDQLDATLGADHRLGQTEEERQVAVDAFFLEDFGCLDAFPGGGDLDQNALTGDAFFFVGADELTRFVDVGLRVEGEAGIHFGGNATWHDLQDFEAKQDHEPVEDGVHLACAGE